SRQPPLQQYSKDPQGTPHDPQWAKLVCKSTHPSGGHDVSPGAHVVVVVDDVLVVVVVVVVVPHTSPHIADANSHVPLPWQSSPQWPSHPREPLASQSCRQTVLVGPPTQLYEQTCGSRVVVVVEAVVVVVLLVEELVEVLLVEVLVDAVVELLVVVVVEVLVVVQSEKQQEHDVVVKGVPPFCLQADSLLTVVHCGGFVN